MSGFKFDPSQSGLRKTLREWEELALRSVWDFGEDGANSRAVWERVNEELGEGNPISRASIIMFLDKGGQGVLGSGDATGKGGHHKVYYPLMSQKGYLKYIIETIVESMMRARGRLLGKLILSGSAIFYRWQPAQRGQW